MNFFIPHRDVSDVSGMSEYLSATEVAISSNSSIVLNDMTKGFLDFTAGGVRATIALCLAVSVLCPWRCRQCKARPDCTFPDLVGAQTCCF